MDLLVVPVELTQKDSSFSRRKHSLLFSIASDYTIVHVVPILLLMP